MWSIRRLFLAYKRCCTAISTGTVWTSFLSWCIQVFQGVYKAEFSDISPCYLSSCSVLSHPNRPFKQQKFQPSKAQKFSCQKKKKEKACDELPNELWHWTLCACRAKMQIYNPLNIIKSRIAIKGKHVSKQHRLQRLRRFSFNINFWIQAFSPMKCSRLKIRIHSCYQVFELNYVWDSWGKAFVLNPF